MPICGKPRLFCHSHCPRSLACSTKITRHLICCYCTDRSIRLRSRAKATTHYPDREGNVRAYKVLTHQHQPEILLSLGEDTHLSFVPVSGPWTRGIWGTAQATLPIEIVPAMVEKWYHKAYAHQPLIRSYAGQLPEQSNVAYSPFCDIGWVLQGQQLVIGFTIDNLLKGAATQAIQNLNLFV